MKTMRFVCVLLLITLFPVSTLAQEAPPFAVNAVSAVLLDSDSGQVLFSQESGLVRVPASLVKVMTMFIAFDHLKQGKISLDNKVIVSEKAWRMGGSQMFLEVGEEVTFEQLLYGVSVVSGNDATVAIAESLAGTEELFVRWMNEKAQQLGIQAKFVDVHGLSDQNQITAADMAKLAWYYVKEHPEALQYHQEKSFSYQPRSQAQPIVQNNRNGLLWTYEGTDGLKTGFLSAAGYNLVATAKQNDRRLIAVILGASSEAVREAEASKLLNYGFRSFELVDTAKLLQNNTVPVYKGQKRTVQIRPATKYITVPKGTEEALEVVHDVKQLSAPLSVNQEVGKLTVRHNGQVLLSTRLVTAEEVERGGFFRVLIDTIRLFFSRIIRRP